MNKQKKRVALYAGIGGTVGGLLLGAPGAAVGAAIGGGLGYENRNDTYRCFTLYQHHADKPATDKDDSVDDIASHGYWHLEDMGDQFSLVVECAGEHDKHHKFMIKPREDGDGVKVEQYD